MTFENLHFLPLSVFVIFPTTFLGTYIAAVLLGHIEPDFPYISDAATYSPESCVFGQLINIGTVLLSLVVYVRFRQIEEYCESYSLSPLILKYNKIGLWLGFISCCGLSLVANFQETNVLFVHLTGAFLCFGFGTIYIWIQAVCSYHLHPLANSIYLAHLRVALAMVCTAFFILLFITGVISNLQYHGENPVKWYPDDGGWALHVVSTASEWVVATAFCLFILTFSREFRTVRIERIQMRLNTEGRWASPLNGQSSPVVAPTSDEVDVIVRRGGSSIIT